MHKSILIADTDFQQHTALATLASDPIYEKHYPLIKAKNLKIAKQIIEDKHVGVGAILINPFLAKNGALDVISSAIQHRPSVPIFYIDDEKKPIPFTVSELEEIGVRGVIKKPYTHSSLIKKFNPIQLSNDTLEKMDYFSGLMEKNHKNIEDKEYFRIHSTAFLNGSKQLFDIFIRLTSGKYIKLLNSNDAFSADQIESYLLGWFGRRSFRFNVGRISRNVINVLWRDFMVSRESEEIFYLRGFYSRHGK